MKKFVSIRQKFIVNVMVLMGVVFLVVLAVIIGLNISTAERNLRRSQHFIRKSMNVRGKVLVRNNSIALKGLVEDNAFIAVQRLVSSTVSGDSDIVRGIYMDIQRRPWVNAWKEDPSGVGGGNTPLSDSIDVWADGITDDTVVLKTYVNKDLDPNNSLVEFAAPVLDDDGNVLGHIRYSFSTHALNQAIIGTRASAVVARNLMIFTLVVIMMLALLFSYFLVKSMATKITRPIASLVKSAKLIAQGDYSIEVVAQSSDEIGKLAVDFDEMRKTIKKYTEHLQDLIDEKMQQVKDILNNIDQGLFTVNFDGSINDEYSSRANEILKVNDVSSHSIYELLRLEEGSQKSFDNWVELVKKKHAKQRWKKLEKLAPVHDMAFYGSGGPDTEFVSVSYQKIYDKSGALSKLMILTMDETEKRIKEQMLQEQRILHENEVKTILGIANTSLEDIYAFIEDSSERLKRIVTEVRDHYDGVLQQRELYPDQEFTYELSEECIEALYRDIHTIKGNGGSYGFDLLTERAHRAEDALEDLKKPLSSRRDDSLRIINSDVNEMVELVNGIASKISLVYGEDETDYVRVSGENIENIERLTETLINNYGSDEAVKELKKYVERFAWKPLSLLARKYVKIVSTAAKKLGKDVKLYLKDSGELFPDDILDDMDEILLHIVRNAVDHGIESDEVRYELDKGAGAIEMAVTYNDSKRIVTVQDNGCGIDTDLIAQKAVEKGVVTEADSIKMSYDEKLKLIFSSGFSTASEVSQISGRGVGMDVVKTKIEEMDGVIDISSVVDEGTTFTITMPL